METLTNLFPNLQWTNFLIIPGLIAGFTIHELGHSLTAYFLGDVTQAKRGMITANPIKHISWLGMVFFVLFGLGWPKPVHLDAHSFKDRYLDSFLVAIAGPAANLVASLLVFLGTAILLGILWLVKLLDGQQIASIFLFSRAHQLASLNLPEAVGNSAVWLIIFTNRVWVANFALALVSLLPLPPFDGFTATLSLLGFIKERRISQLTGTRYALKSPVAASPVPPVPVPKTAAEIHFQAGTNYHNQQKFDDAIARYRQSIKNDPSFGPAYVNLGLAYKAKDQQKEAIQAFKGATQYAADDKSQDQGWAELFDLNAIPGMPSATAGYTKNQNPGTSPWTNTAPTPNWVALFWGGIVFVLSFSCIIGIIIANF